MRVYLSLAHSLTHTNLRPLTPKQLREIVVCGFKRSFFAGPYSAKRKCVYVFIYIYIYIYVSVSLSFLQHTLTSLFPPANSMNNNRYIRAVMDCYDALSEKHHVNERFTEYMGSRGVDDRMQNWFPGSP